MSLRPNLPASLGIVGAFVVAPLAFIASTVAPAAAADTTCIAGEGTETSTYNLPQDAVGVRSFLSGEAGDGFTMSYNGYVRPDNSYAGGRGALLVSDITVAGGTELKLGTLAGAGGGARRGSHYTYQFTPIQNGGDAAYLAKVGQQCSNLLAVAGGGGGAGGAGEEQSIKTAWPDSKTIKIYSGTHGGDAGDAVDGFVGATPDNPDDPWDQPLQAKAGQETDLNGQADGGVGGGATSTAGGGRGTPGHGGDGFFNTCKGGFYGTEGTFLHGGLGGPSALPGSNCDQNMGAAGGGAGYYGGGGGGSAGGMATSGSGGGGSSFLAPGNTVVRASLTGDTSAAAPRVIPIYAPTMAVTADNTNVPFGGTAKLTATLNKFPSNGGGTVTFIDSWTGQPLPGNSTVAVTNGQAKFTTNPYTFVSDYQVQARYSGQTDETKFVLKPANSTTYVLPSGHFGSVEIHVLPENFPITVTGTWPYRGEPNFIAQFGTLPNGLFLGGKLTCTKLSNGATITESTNAGTYTVDPSSCSGLTKSGPNAAKFNLVYSGGGFSITRPTVSVEVDGFHTFGSSDKYFYINPNVYALPPGINAGGDINCSLANGSDPASPALAVGSYALGTCTGVALGGAGADNYDIDVDPNNYYVGQGSIGITATGSGEYLSNADPFTYTTTPLPSGVTVSGTLTCTTINGNRAPNNPSNDAGLQSIDANHCSGLTLGGASAGSYALQYLGGKYTVRQKPFHISIDGSQDLGGSGRTFTATADQDIPPGLTLPSIPGQDPKCTRVAGGVPIDEALPYSTTKYDLEGTSCTGLFLTGGSGTHVQSYKTIWHGQFKVNLPPPIDVVVRGTQTYGDSHPIFTITTYNPPGIDLAGELTCTTVDGGAPIAPDLTAYTSHFVDAASCSGLTPTGLNADLYTVAYQNNGQFNVAQAPLTIKADDASFVYRDPRPTITASYSGFLFNDSPDNVFNDAGSQGPTCFTNADQIHAGVQHGVAKCQGARLSNYDPSYVDGDVTVTKRDLTATPVAKTMAFGGTPPDYSTLADVNYTGFATFDNAVNALGTRPTCTANVTALTQPGDYPTLSSCSGGTSENYELHYALGQVKITGDVLTVTAPSETITYGEVVPDLSTPTYKSLEPVSGDVSDGSERTHDATCTTTATSSSPAGDYPVTCSGAAWNGNAIVYNDGTLTIDKAPLTVTAVAGPATYKGGAASVTASYDGFINGEDADDLTTKPTCSSSAPDAAGTYTDAATCAGAASENYAVTYVADDVVVGKRTLTITAGDGNSAYGANGPTITASYDGFANGDNAANSLSTFPICQPNTDASTLPGTYPATATCTGAASPNYAITYAKGAITVTKAVLTVTGPSPAKVYGGALPTLPPGYSGFVGVDGAATLSTAPACTTTATGASAVGSYPVTCSGGVSDKYSFGYTAGTLTVTQAPLTITASNAQPTYGDTPPTITPSFSGFVNGDAASSLGTAPTCTSNITSSTAVGVYLDQTTCSGAVAANYEIAYVKGNITITQAPLQVTPTAVTQVYGAAAAPVPTPQYAGLKNGETSAALGNPATCSAGLSSTTSVGDHSDLSICSGVVSSNYHANYAHGITTVTRAPVVVTAGQTTKVWGVPGVIPIAYYSGLKNGQNASALTTAPSCRTTVITTTSVGSHPETNTCSGAAAANYSFTYVPGTAKVLRATLTTVGTPIAVARSPKGSPVTFTAKVTINATGRPVSGILITFTTVSDPEHTLTCKAYTNAAGVAKCTKAHGTLVLRSPSKYRITGPSTTSYLTRTTTATMVVE